MFWNGLIARIARFATLFALLPWLPVHGEAAPELPIEAFFRDPLLMDAKLSPSGRYVAAVAVKEEDRFIMVWDLEKGEHKPIIRFSMEEAAAQRKIVRPPRLQQVDWASEERLLFMMVTPVVGVPGRNAFSGSLYGIDRDGANSKILVDYIWGDPIHMLPEDPEHSLINHKNGAYRIDIRSGKLKRIQTPKPHISGWYADQDGKPRLGIGQRRTILRIVARTGGRGSLSKIFEGDVYEESDFIFHGFDPVRANIIYVASNHEGDRRAMYEFDITKKAFVKKIFEHPRVDVDSIAVSKTRGKALAVGYIDDRREWHYLDDEYSLHIEGIERALGDVEVSVTSTNLAEDRWIIQASGTTRAPVTYLYNTGTRKLIKLFESYPELDERVLSPTRSIRFEARDGLEISGYLTVPRGVEAKDLPTVVLVHGGPMARDTWGFDREVQFLANRGHAVLQINFRGSEGFGSEFLARGYGRWGLEMQDDLTDGVRWLIGEGIADPDRVAIYGISYGAYASLMGVVKDPSLYRAAAGYAGPYDLLAFKAEDAWRGIDHSMAVILGDNSKSGTLAAVSPARHADRIQVPVLLAHGLEDWRVNYSQSEEMAAALKNARVPHELILLEHEHHALEFRETRIRFYAALESFLETNLVKRTTAAAE